jgi:peptide/nickel transport system substrate-binding protein
MWGSLPVPRYLAHNIFQDNAAGTTALRAGEVDVSQQFNSNVQDLWLTDGLPISTYLPEAPYGIGASLPTAFFNLTGSSFGLDNIAVRRAISMAVDYDAIIANAMTNQSATFTQVPRSLMNPTAGEQSLYDHAAVADLQWSGNDVAGANALLDEAGIVDTDGDGIREIDGHNLSYVATFRMAGLTGKPRLKWSPPLVLILVSKSPPITPNGLCIKRLSPSPMHRCPKAMTSS